MSIYLHPYFNALLSDVFFFSQISGEKGHCNHHHCATPTAINHLQNFFCEDCTNSDHSDHCYQLLLLVCMIKKEWLCTGQPRHPHQGHDEKEWLCPKLTIKHVQPV